MAHVLTFEQYREWVNDYLDQLEAYADDEGEEQVVVVGDLTGSVNVHAASQNKDSKRINGQIGYPSEMWNKPGTEPISGALHGRIDRTRLLGSTVVPRSTLSDSAEERIAEKQDDLEDAQGGDDGE